MIPALAGRLPSLRQRYAEPHRVYHGQSHVDAMLLGLAGLAAGLAHPEAAEVAVWYHDAIYDPAAADNEACSAALLRAELSGLAAPRTIDVAALMIRLTASHALPPDVPEALRSDCAAFLDLDMAVLGAAPAAYDAYEAGIAGEYVPEHGAAAYRKGRAAFLAEMLARPRLFHTDRAHTALDAPARQPAAGARTDEGSDGPHAVAHAADRLHQPARRNGAVLPDPQRV